MTMVAVYFALTALAAGLSWLTSTERVQNYIPSAFTEKPSLLLHANI